MRSAYSVILKHGFTECGINQNYLKCLRLIISKIKHINYTNVVFDSKNIFLDDNEMYEFSCMLERLKKNEPISKIISVKSFWNHDFFVNSDVLDPRPETELIIEIILSRFNKSSSLRILDVGTGSGCILLSLMFEYKNSYGLGIDASAKAIEVAKHNQKKLKILNADFLVANWNYFFEEIKFDIIVSNPPYIKTEDIASLDENVKNYDPLLALDGGTTGLDAYVSISQLAKKLLKTGGSIFFEVGYNQSKSVSEILTNSGLKIDEIKKDINGIDRVISAFN